MSAKRKALLLGSPGNLQYVYPDPLMARMEQMVDWTLPPERGGKRAWEPTVPAALPPDTECVFSTWGMPVMDEAFLASLPALQAVFYGAGSVRGFVTDASWRRGVRVFSAARANAVPVAEFTAAQIVLGLKQVSRLRVTSLEGWKASGRHKDTMRGNYGGRVGLISYGTIARLTRRLLRPYDLEILVYDPFLSAEEAAREDLLPAGLEEIFRECHVVSLHTPLLDSTRNMIRGQHLASMREDACFINTARGAIVHQEEMTAVLAGRPDLTAILDVLHPEPPAADEPLLRLPNAWVTPHLAGSMGHECGRMGAYMFDAFKDFVAGRASPHEVREADMERIA
jgi:phosphoglycerate dehydrogenase-like enzyme